MRFNCYNATAEKGQRHMRRMRNIWVHVCRQLCTSSVHEKSRLIPIFYAQSKQKKGEKGKSNGNYMMYMMLAPSCCKLLFSLAPSPLPCPFRALSLLFFCSALSFNLLHEKCFIVARATASTNLAAFNKLWLHCPRPPLASSLTTSWHSSSLLFLLPIVALAFGRRVFCFPFTSSNWIKLPRFRRALCFCCNASQVFSAGKRSFRYAIFSLSLSFSLSLARFAMSVCRLQILNCAQCWAERKKIIGHKKCHSKAKEKKNSSAILTLFPPVVMQYFSVSRITADVSSSSSDSSGSRDPFAPLPLPL